MITCFYKYSSNGSRHFRTEICVAIDTPVGAIAAELHADGAVSVENVPSYRKGL